jgi:hypothetical protein
MKFEENDSHANEVNGTINNISIAFLHLLRSIRKYI